MKKDKKITTPRLQAKEKPWVQEIQPAQETPPVGEKPQEEPDDRVEKMSLPRTIHLVPMSQISGYEVRPGFYEINGATAIRRGELYRSLPWSHFHRASAVSPVGGGALCRAALSRELPHWKRVLHDCL